jgi:2-polyprenyl-3-methyl-5-hydroxy-6-metoxy-1,4-benzoquinol methylase
MRPCRLCQNPSQIIFEDVRPFYACNVCGLIFSDCLLSAEEVEKHYKDQYQNEWDWGNEAEVFVLWLKNFRGTAPSLSLSILDYGSGGGLLAEALRKVGFKVDCYEPMLHGDFNRESYSEAYDIIILNEVIEHLEDINKTLDIVYNVLADNGVVFIKTNLTDKLINNPLNFQKLFKGWWYKDDPTHISFFSFLTIEYICKDRGRRLEVRAISETDNCVMLQKI